MSGAFSGESRHYSFNGTLKDTTNGNSLAGLVIYYKFARADYKMGNTILDSTYSISIYEWFPHDTNDFKTAYNSVQLRDSNNAILSTFDIPHSIWIEDGIATYDYSFYYF